MRAAARYFCCVSAFLLIATLACHRAAAGNVHSGAASSVTDGNILAIILAANNTDLSYARLVPARSRSADVRAFGLRMTTDHTILSARANDIAMRNGISTQDNATSLDFRDHSADRRDILRELQGARFDSAYAANEVQYHTELLAALNIILLPNARNAELRGFVNLLRPAASAHLAHAQQLRAALAAKK